MMVLNHSIGSGSARTSITCFTAGFRARTLMRRCLKARGFVCIAVWSSRFSLGALHSDCSLLMSGFQGVAISTEACTNA